MKTHLFLPLLFLLSYLSFGQQASAAAPEEDSVKAILRYRAGLESTLEFAKSRPDLFPQQKIEHRVTSPESKAESSKTWQSFLEYLYGLDAIGKSLGVQNLPRGTKRRETFVKSRAAFLAGYRFSLEWIALVENDPSYSTLFNESWATTDGATGVYDQLKARFLNPARATEFAALETLAAAQKKLPDEPLNNAIESDRARIWEFGKGKGYSLTAKNALSILEKHAMTAWFPVQANVANWMGDVRVHRGHRFLISKDQVEELKKRLEPGDILLERREWFLSNVGLPGFWTHSALYVGTPEERRAYFEGDNETKAWLESIHSTDGFENWLEHSYPKSFDTKSPEPKEGKARILEAIGEGVLLTALEHSADADSLAVLRPRLSKKEKAVALAKAFSYAGRPYDFNFDFVSDDTLVCSELIYKAYQPGLNSRGIDLPLIEMTGRLLLPPTKIAEVVIQEGADNPDRRFDLVVFFDGREWENRAIEREFSAFAKTPGRPKWHVWTQPLDKVRPL